MQHDFILMDRSGSMRPLWEEALNSVNGYVKKLANDNVDTGVTLATFDKDDGKLQFDVIRDRITPKTWASVTDADAVPRGMTPLNDAIGRTVSLANKGFNGTPYDKVAIIIMTDGMENASEEYTHEAAKKLLDECRAKGWQVIFLGANFDNAAQATSYGNMRGQTVNSSRRNLGQTMTHMASARASYGATGQSMSFSEDLKEKLRQEK